MDFIIRLNYSGFFNKKASRSPQEQEMVNLAKTSIPSLSIQAPPFYSLYPKKGEITEAVSSNHPKSPPSIKSTPVKLSGYIDMGVFEGIITKAITWSSEKFPNGYYDQDKLNKALDQIFDALAQDGTNQISLSFSQITDIAKLIDPDDLTYTPSDKILEILRWNTAGVKNLNKPIVTNGNIPVAQDIIQYIISRAKTKGINTDLSFGGAAATGSDYVFPESAEQSALDLVKFLDEYKIDSVDFDIEDLQGFLTNSQTDVLTFFKTLKSALNKENKKVYLTLLGSTSQGPDGPLKFLFDEFNSCADGVRLMLYDGGTHFYIDKDNSDWGLNKWLGIVGKDPKKLALGFYDKIPYEDPKNSDAAYNAKKYEGFPTNPTRALAAAWIYKKVASQMGLNINDFDEPFFWTDNPQTIPTNEFLIDFNKDLNS